MNRVHFFRHDENGSVQRAVVLVTQSHGALKAGGMRYRTVAEAERDLLALGWTRKKLKPLTAVELAMFVVEHRAQA